MIYKRGEDMGKRHNFLGFLASLFMVFFVGNAFADGYTCPSLKKYTSCNANYYLNGTDVGNACVQCPSGSGWQSTTSAGNTSTSCTCPDRYWQSQGDYNVVSGETCVLASVTCSAGTYLKANATSCTACPAGSYCKGGTFTSSSSNQGISTCPSGYPNSAASSDAITDCYSNTKSRAWTGSQTPCTKPSNCATVQCNTCSKSACDYVAYSNPAGTGDGTIKSGCSTNNASCQQTVKSVTANSGYYANGTTCSQCPSGYRDGSGASSINECVGEFTKTGTQQPPATPSGCSSITTGTCSPGSCSYTKKYSGTIVSDCTPTNCTKPITGVTASANYYSNGTTCMACLSGYSSPAGATSPTQCTKSCSVNCVKPSCPEHSASCSFGSETATGTMNQVTQTCSASAPTCSMTFTCETGYQKSGNSCIPNTYEVSYSCGTGSGNAPGGTSQQYGGSYVIASNTCSKPGYTFSGWSDGSTIKQPGQITWTYTKDITFTAQWSACSANTNGAGTCGCSATQYPNGSGCSNCSVSCSSVSGFTKGTYNVCNSQTNSICYRDCTTSDVPNASSVTGTVTKGGTKTCAATQCNENYYISGSGCAACVPNATCPGGGETFECNPGYHLSTDGRSCEPDEYTITLNKNGGTGSINGSSGTANATQKCKHGVLCDLPSSGLTKTGYAFTGWGESSGCTSGVYQTTFTSAKTMYACWSQQTTQCQAGKYYNGTSHVDCPSGSFCPGTGFANIGQAGCSTTCPSGYTGSDTGSTAATGCYKTCGGKTITGGTATVVSAKVYYNGSSYPACTYNVNCNPGYVASGNGTANATCNKCQDGVNCPGGSDETEPEECPEGSYCEEGIEHECPAGGTSEAGSGDITDCYKTCPPTLDIENGQGISTGNQYYDGSKYPECQYRAECNTNYVPENSPSTNPSCVWGDPNECPAGSYCPEDGSGPIACPDGGTSERGATYVTECYKVFDPYSGFQNGVASAKCFYIEGTNKYERCSILEVKSCKAGYWYSTPNAFLCSGVTSGYYSPENDTDQTACPVDPSGSKVESSEYADSFTDCYKECKIEIPNSTSIAAKENTVYGISASAYAACSFAVTCETGYTVQSNNTETPSCKANEYTITLDKNGGTGSVAASVKCTFNSGSCQLPATTGLTRDGYTVVAKWCSDKNGGSPCYDAGTSIATNISATGVDTTLYAVWTPNIYTVNLDSTDSDVAGEPSTVYLKYATGWFSNSVATTSISEMTKLPTKSGFELAGYYSASTGGTQIVNASGEFQTSEEALTMTTTSPATIYVRWAAGKTTCQPGTYYPGTGNQCVQCTANNYCPGGSFATNSGHAEGINTCPDQGLSPRGTDSVTKCYKTKLTYTATHGSGTQTCQYNQSSSDYSAQCTDKVINICDAGYYLADAGAETPDCEVVGKGYYSDGSGTSRTQCPSSGLTETDTATMVQNCYKGNLPYAAIYGTGTQRCFYSSGTGADAVYQRDCDTKVINSCRGGYWLAEGSDTDCSPVTQNFYSDPDDTERHECPNSGKTESDIADSISLCYKDGLPYTEALHGTGEYLCYYTSGEGTSAIYASSCETPTMTSCDAGYYYDKIKKVDDCIESGIGYYSPAVNTSRFQCPQNGITATKTSSAITECFREDIVCPIANGSGEQTCNYNETDSDYTASCQTCTVVSCDEGYSQVDNTCINCPAGSVCEEGEQKTCSSLTGGQYPESEAGTTDVAMCYKDCAMAQNAAAMSGRDYYQAPDTCKIARCLAGYTLENGACTECPEGSFCDGTIDPDQPGGDAKSCADLGDGSWEFSLPGAKDESGCYQKCEEYDVENGTAVPVSEKAFYPNKCEFKGVSDTGNPCEIVDDVCVEVSCNGGYEMVDGKCEPCDVEFALSYKETGVCQVATCVLGYHPNGRACEKDITECSAPNAIYAEQKWDYNLNAFGPCMIKECESEYHLASNACVSDVQPCTVENGIGFKEWNHASKNWGKCIATSCDPGYTNDPSETNERTKQCGECKNKYSILGQLAASSYVQGCEIAACLYQGELYNLDNNECVPICPQEEYEDETGTMVWDQAKKKCVRTCKEGYTMW